MKEDCVDKGNVEQKGLVFEIYIIIAEARAVR